MKSSPNRDRPAPRIAFLACLERGPLEQQTRLMCRSIRRWAGRCAQAPIHTFQPRAGAAPDPETIGELKDLEVIHHDLPLNTETPEYGFGNKIYVSAWAEQNLEEEILVFLDSDTVMTGDAGELLLPDSLDAAARPAHSESLNSTGPGDPNDPYWMDVHRLFGLRREAFVETETGRTVRAFFSAGLIAARRSAGVFGQWLRDFRGLRREGLLPPGSGIRRLDEVALAVTLIRVFDRLKILDGRFNYLLYRRPELKSPHREAQLEELVHVHYRDVLRVPGFLRQVQPPLHPESPVVRWLEQYLPQRPILRREQAAR